MALSIQLSTADPLQTRADLLAIAVHPGARPKSAVMDALDRALGGGLARHLEREEFKGNKDQTAELATLGKLRGGAAKVMLVGLGAADEMSDADWRAAGARLGRAASGAKVGKVALALPEALAPAKLRALAEGLVLGCYRFTKYFTGERRPASTLTHAEIVVPRGGRAGVGKAEQDAVATGAKVGEAVCIARDLVNEPPNELVPADLAAAARRVAQKYGLKCQVWDRREIERRGMKLVIAVGQGSAHEPRFVHMTYTPPAGARGAKAGAKRSARGSGAKKKIVVVGKGLTFDSGGLCIKPAAGMGEMKSDMAGAANVIALMAACSIVKPAVEVHGLVGSAENMPDGNAYRPGDVFGSLDGKTVEIINTDAEGRLVLADALAFARRLDPDLIVDNATLTGACIVALGKSCSAFYATQDEWAERFTRAAKIAGEQFWRLPLLGDLKEQLKSDIADLKHTGDRWGGSITAALFLREFVGNTPWIHLDIAGPSFGDRPAGIYPKGGTGHGVLTLLELVESMQ